MTIFNPARSADCAAADLMPVMVAAVDRDGVYQYANRVFGAYFGVRPDEIIGRSIDDLQPLTEGITAADRDRAIRRCIDQGCELELTALVRKIDGERRKFVIRLVGDKEKQVCFAYMSDVTDRDPMVERLERDLVRALASRVA